MTSLLACAPNDAAHTSMEDESKPSSHVHWGELFSKIFRISINIYCVLLIGMHARLCLISVSVLRDILPVKMIVKLTMN
jgi:hypothetical protein